MIDNRNYLNLITYDLNFMRSGKTYIVVYFFGFSCNLFLSCYATFNKLQVSRVVHVWVIKSNKVGS